jgi:CRP/FNR family transcriptional regulator
MRGDGFFCQLSSGALKDYNAIKFPATYPAGAVMFMEKQDPRGVFLLCAGQVKLSISSSGGKTLIIRIARPGEVLGLKATMSGDAYEATAETLHPCQVAFVRRDEFLRFVSNHPEVWEGVVKQLSALYCGACEQLRTVGLSASAPEKLARLLLQWSAEAKQAGHGAQIKVPLTHEEIAECIGTTRETVTRTLSDFKSRRLVSLKGSTLLIADRLALEQIVGV